MLRLTVASCPNIIKRIKDRVGVSLVIGLRKVEITRTARYIITQTRSDGLGIILCNRVAAPTGFGIGQPQMQVLRSRLPESQS